MMEQLEYHHGTGESLADINKNYSGNYAWLAECINPPAKNRFEIVRDVLSDAASKYDEKSRRMTSDFDENPLFMAAYEAFRFNEVVGYLRKLNKAHLPIKKIRAMCKGPAYSYEERPESGNSEGRDIQFELILAAHLNRSGLTVSNHDDVQLQYADCTINYECKRPANIKNYKNRFEDALLQLDKKILGHGDQFGIVSFSIEKFDDIHTRMFRGNDTDGVIQITARIRDDILKHMRGNLRIVSSRQIIGFHLWMNTYIWDKDRGRFSPINVHFTERTVPESKIDLHDYLLDEIKIKLSKNLRNAG
jgi:hypothetical protein